MRLNYQGRLVDDQDQPQVGSRLMYFSIYRGGTADGAIPGLSQYVEAEIVELDANGVFEHAIGSGTRVSGDLTPAIFNSPTPVYIQFAVCNVTNALLPRTQVTSVGYAMVADNAVGDITPASGSISGFGEVIDSDGNWVGVPISGGGGGGGIRHMAILYPDGQLQRADGSFQKSATRRLLAFRSSSTTPTRTS